MNIKIITDHKDSQDELDPSAYQPVYDHSSIQNYTLLISILIGSIIYFYFACKNYVKDRNFISKIGHANWTLTIALSLSITLVCIKEIIIWSEETIVTAILGTVVAIINSSISIIIFMKSLQNPKGQQATEEGCSTTLHVIMCVVFNIVVMGGMAMALYDNCITIIMFILFFCSIAPYLQIITNYANRKAPIIPANLYRLAYFWILQLACIISIYIRCYNKVVFLEDYDNTMYFEILVYCFFGYYALGIIINILQISYFGNDSSKNLAKDLRESLLANNENTKIETTSLHTKQKVPEPNINNLTAHAENLNGYIQKLNQLKSSNIFLRPQISDFETTLGDQSNIKDTQGQSILYEDMNQKYNNLNVQQICSLYKVFKYSQCKAEREDYKGVQSFDDERGVKFSEIDHRFVRRVSEEYIDKECFDYCCKVCGVSLRLSPQKSFKLSFGDRKKNDNELFFATPCEHFFHKECFSKWTEIEGKNCPTCLKDLEKYKQSN